MKVNVFHGAQGPFDHIAGSAEFFHRKFITQRQTGLRTGIFIYHLRKFRFQLFVVGPWPKLYVGSEIVTQPLRVAVVGSTDKSQHHIIMKMTGSGHILIHACDLVVVFIFKDKGLANWVFIGEIFLSSALTNDHRVGIVQRIFRITLNKRNGENVKYGTVGKDNFIFLNILINPFDKDGAIVPKTPGGLHFGIIISKCIRHRSRCHSHAQVIRPELNFTINAVNPVCRHVMAVVAQFIRDIQNDQKAGSNTDGQTEYIDGCVKTMFAQIPQSDRHIIFQHKSYCFVFNR